MNFLAPLIRPRIRLPELRLSTTTVLVLIVAAGVAVRLVHYLKFPSVWCDEAAMLMNALDLDFSQMCGPLLHHEAAPPLFIAAERCIYLHLGDSIAAMRLLPFLASCGSVLLMALLARLLLGSHAALWATALFAASDVLLRHATEAKPYAVDVFVSLAIAHFYLRTLARPMWQRCLVALPVLPTALWLSFPACFAVAGLFIGQLPSVIRSRSRRDWALLIAVAAAVSVSFLALVLGPVRAQRDDELVSCWVAIGFADWRQSWDVPIWMARSTIDIFSYLMRPAGLLLVGLAVTGAVALWRQNDRQAVLTALVPWGLALLAGLLGKYPYCGERVVEWLAPAVCLLTAAGVAPMTNWLRERSRVSVWLLWLVLALPFGNTAFRAVWSWPRTDSDASARYVLGRWQAGDRIVFANSEREYYFRRIASARIAPKDVVSAAPSRLWHIAERSDPSQKEAVLQAAPTYRVLERTEFKCATVTLYGGGSD
jgi:hypothetical protein